MGAVTGSGQVKAWTSAGLVALLAVSFALFARSQGPGGGQTSGMPAPSAEGSPGLPDDHPAVGPPALFQSRFEDLAERLADNGEDAEALLALAQLLHDAHRPLEAVGYYHRYLALMPDSAHVWLYLANAYGTAGDWDDAAEVSLRLLERFPEHAGGLYNLGASYANLGRYGDARTAWEKALEAGESEVARQAAAALARLSEIR